MARNKFQVDYEGGDGNDLTLTVPAATNTPLFATHTTILSPFSGCGSEIIALLTSIVRPRRTSRVNLISPVNPFL